MTAGIKTMASRDTTTISAGYAKALLDLAVSKGTSSSELIERSGIDPDVLLDQDNRVPLTTSRGSVPPV